MEKSSQKAAENGGAPDGRQPAVSAGAVCDRGLNPKRPVNQDRYLSITEMGLFAVFDGVGGRKAGEVASQTAADTVEETFAADSKIPSTELIRRAILFANRDIYELGRTEPEYGSMATTVALLHVDGNRATIAHVGDSRVYRLSDGELSRETIDHTDLDDRIRAGLISQDAARLREDDHSINRALGVETGVDLELKTIEVRSGDRFLLCTDGVYRHLDDDELAPILQAIRDPQAAADEIRRVVLERGADDNLTAVVVQIEGLAFDGRSRTGQASTITTGNRAPLLDNARSIGSERRPGGRPTKDRIHVRLGPEDRNSTYGDDETDRDEAPSEDGEPDSTRRSNTVIYVLLVLVLMLGSFYGGLRSSNLLNKKRSSLTPREAQLEQGRHAYDGGDFRDAEQAFSALTASDPKDAGAWYWLGRTELQERRFAESARSLERAAELAPDMADTYVQAAAAFEAMGNRAKAVEMLGRYAEAARKHEPGM